MGEQKYNMVFAKNLQYFLDLNKMRPAELARRLAVAESTVSRWLAAETSPRMDKVDEMTKIFRIKRSDLITPRKNGNHYFDAKTRDIANDISKNKELRLLFDAARNVGAEDLQSIADILKKLKRKERGDNLPNKDD